MNTVEDVMQELNRIVLTIQETERRMMKSEEQGYYMDVKHLL